MKRPTKNDRLPKRGGFRKGRCGCWLCIGGHLCKWSKREYVTLSEDPRERRTA